jgi:hypothetical protein
MGNMGNPERRFHVGDSVRFLFGVSKVDGTVVEDRGPLGVGGRRLYRIRFQFAADEEPMHIELPAADIEWISDTPHEIPGSR